MSQKILLNLSTQTYPKLSILCNPQYMQVKYYMYDVYFSQGLSHVLYDLIRDILHFKTMYPIPGIYGLYKDIYSH